MWDVSTSKILGVEERCSFARTRPHYISSHLTRSSNLTSTTSHAATPRPTLLSRVALGEVQNLYVPVATIDRLEDREQHSGCGGSFQQSGLVKSGGCSRMSIVTRSGAPD